MISVGMLAKAASSLLFGPRRVPAGLLHPSLPLVKTLCSSIDDENVGESNLPVQTPRRLGERRKKTVAFRQQYACASCSCILPPDFQIDHVVPLALGGSNGESNLQALCRRCHEAKTREQRHEIASARMQRNKLARPDEAASPSTVMEPLPSVEGDPAVLSVNLQSPQLSPLAILEGTNQQQLSAVVLTDGPVRGAST